MTNGGHAVRVAVLTISDSGAKGERQDTSGDVIAEIADREGYRQVFREIVPDEKELIAAKLRDWCDGGQVDLVLTTGGTGLGPRDVTPEATAEVIDIAVPGITEAIRVETMKKTPFAMLSRSVAGVRAGTLVLNLPGSPKGVRECLEVAVPVLPHGLAMIEGRRGHPTH